MTRTAMTTAMTITVKFEDEGGGVVAEDEGRDEVVRADKQKTCCAKSSLL